MLEAWNPQLCCSENLKSHTGFVVSGPACSAGFRCFPYLFLPIIYAHSVISLSLQIIVHHHRSFCATNKFLASPVETWTSAIKVVATNLNGNNLIKLLWYHF
jgi:hypothetical protein